MISANLPRRTGLATNAGPGKGFEWRGIRANIVISENLPRRTGLAANAGPAKLFECRRISASIVISENLPRRKGLSANAGLGTGLEWTPGGRGWEPGAGRQEAGEIRMFNHWATGLRSGLLPQVVVLQHQKLLKKVPNLKEVFAKVLIFGARGRFFEGFWYCLLYTSPSPRDRG